MKPSKIDWQMMGRFVERLVVLFTTIQSTFKNMKVGLELVDWCNGEGKKLFVGKLQELALEYQKTLKAINILRTNLSLSLEEMIKLGQYGWVNSSITSTNFPPEGKGKGVEEVEYKIFHFDKDMSSEAVLTQMKEEGYEPAKIHHLLSFGVQNPEEQKSYPIIALGSFAEVVGSWSVSYLDFGGGMRKLNLHSRDGGWRGHCRFLGVRKL